MLGRECYQAAGVIRLPIGAPALNVRLGRSALVLFAELRVLLAAIAADHVIFLLRVRLRPGQSAGTAVRPSGFRHRAHMRLRSCPSHCPCVAGAENLRQCETEVLVDPGMGLTAPLSGMRTDRSSTRFILRRASDACTRSACRPGSFGGWDEACEPGNGIISDTSRWDRFRRWLKRGAMPDTADLSLSAKFMSVSLLGYRRLS